MPSGIAGANVTYPAALIGFIAITVVVMLLLRRTPGLAAAWACFLIMVFPTLGITMIFGRTTLADRFVYLPLLALILPAVFGMGRTIEAARGWMRAVVVGVCLLALVTLAGLSIQQCRHWKDSVAFWSRSVEQNPGDYFSLGALGEAYNLQSAFDKAAFWYSKAISRNAYYSGSHYGYSIALKGLGQTAGALRSLDTAISLQTAVYGMTRSSQAKLDLLGFHQDRFGLLVLMGRHIEAVDEFLRYADLSGIEQDVLVIFGTRLVREGRLGEAIGLFQQILATVPRGKLPRRHQ